MIGCDNKPNVASATTNWPKPVAEPPGRGPRGHPTFRAGNGTFALAGERAARWRVRSALLPPPRPSLHDPAGAVRGSPETGRPGPGPRQARLSLSLGLR